METHNLDREQLKREIITGCVKSLQKDTAFLYFAISEIYRNRKFELVENNNEITVVWDITNNLKLQELQSKMEGLNQVWIDKLQAELRRYGFYGEKQ